MKSCNSNDGGMYFGRLKTGFSDIIVSKGVEENRR